jgi:aspartyl protease family protein
MNRSWIALSRDFSLSLALLAAPALAADVTLVGLIGTKAIVVINGGRPRTIAVGQKTPEGVVLTGTEKDAADFEIDGKKRTLRMGQAYSAPAGTGKQSVVLSSDSRGHFVVMGSINGGSVQFMVDTGATLIAMPASEARRLGINYQQGQRMQMRTANGIAIAFRVKLDTVKIGDIVVNSVDAVVGEDDAMGITLLGMSFLNRMEMKRDGPTMTLTKRY